MRKILLFSLLLLVIAVAPALAGTAHLSWEASPSTNVVGYKVFYGSDTTLPYSTALSNYTGTEAVLGTSPVDVGDVLMVDMEIVPDAAKKFYFTIVAYDQYGNMSIGTNQVNKIIGAVDPPGILQIE